MKYISLKSTAAILTFSIGTILVAAFVAVETKILTVPTVSLPEEAFITNSEPDLMATPDAAPKWMTFTESKSLEGKKAALRNIKKGKLIILVRGETKFQQLLGNSLSKHGIEIESIGCFFSKEDELFLGGYNEVSKAAINARFGRGFIEQRISAAAQDKKGTFKNKQSAINN